MTPGVWNTWPAAQAFLQWTDAAGNANSLQFDCVVNEGANEDAEATEHPVEVGANIVDHVRVKPRQCTLKLWATNEPIDGNNWDEATLTSVDVYVPGSADNVTGSKAVQAPGTITVPSWNNPIELRAIGGSLVGFAGSAIGGALGGAKTGQLAGDLAAIAGLEAALLAFPAEEVPNIVQVDAGLDLSPGKTVTAQVQQFPGGAEGTDYVAKMIAQLKLLKDTAQQLDVTLSKTFCSPMVVTKLSTVREAGTGTGADITLELTEVRVVSTKTVAAPIPNLPSGGGTPPKNAGKKDAADAPPQTQKKLITSALKWAEGMFS